MMMLQEQEPEDLVRVGNNQGKKFIVIVWALLTAILVVKTFLPPSRPLFYGDTIIIKDGDRETSIPVSQSTRFEILKEEKE